MVGLELIGQSVEHGPNLHTCVVKYIILTASSQGRQTTSTLAQHGAIGHNVSAPLTFSTKKKTPGHL